MRITINSILSLPEELRFVLKTIWHPEEGDQFFFLDSLGIPSPIHSYDQYNRAVFDENRLYAFPLFTMEQLIKIIEDYGGYQMVKEVVIESTSLNELFNMLWEKIIYILEDGESAEYWFLTVPATERQVPTEIEISLPFPGTI